MKNIFQFGEKVDGYDINVFNERELRAGAGILFLFALPIFLISCTSRDFFLTKIFITFFLIDFFIRIFINPKYSPSLILGRIAVANQKPEYSGAPQKKFAWMIGFILAVIMFFTMVIFNYFLLVNFFLCTLCVILLFFESSFGICIGCKMYDFFHKDKKAELCPGGVCEISKKEEIQKVSKIQVLILSVAIIFLGFLTTLDIFAKKVVFVHDLKNQEIQSDNENDFKIEDLGKINNKDSEGCIFSDALKKIGDFESPCGK